MPRGIPKNGKRAKADPSRRCSVCRHVEKQRILSMHVAGFSLDRLAEKFGLSRDSLHRHLKNHVTAEERACFLVGKERIGEIAELAISESASLVSYLSILRSTLFNQLVRLAALNDHKGVATITAQALNVLCELGKITGEISSLVGGTTINISNHTTILSSAPFIDLQSGLLRICEMHPSARGDIVNLFRDLDSKYLANPAKVIEGQVADA
jgi:hypothetical protein